MGKGGCLGRLQARGGRARLGELRAGWVQCRVLREKEAVPRAMDASRRGRGWVGAMEPQGGRVQWGEGVCLGKLQAGVNVGEGLRSKSYS